MPSSSRRGSAVGWAVAALAAAIAVLLVGYQVNKVHEQQQTRIRAMMLTGGDPDAGRVAAARYGCGGCHTIPGVVGGRGLSAPPLAGLGQRVWIAGRLRNTPQNLIAWIQAPRAIDPHNAMPNMGVTDRDARDIAAYLYTAQ